MNIEEAKKVIVMDDYMPNCLLATVDSAVRYKFKIQDLHRLYLHTSYVYSKTEGEMRYDFQKEQLNVELSRELPIVKEDFIKRLKEYYNIVIYSHMYEDFDELMGDIKRLVNAGEVVITAFDMFYLQNHPCNGRVHDGHEMLIYGVDEEEDKLNVFEGVYQHSQYPIETYKQYFDYCMKERGRGIALAILKRNDESCNKINLQYMKEDIDKILQNLSSMDEEKGLKALDRFCSDFITFIENTDIRELKDFTVPGIWSLKCDFSNSMKFFKKVKEDYPELCSETIDQLIEENKQLRDNWFRFEVLYGDKEKIMIGEIRGVLAKLQKDSQDMLENLKKIRQEL